MHGFCTHLPKGYKSSGFKNLFQQEIITFDYMIHFESIKKHFLSDLKVSLFVSDFKQYDELLMCFVF
jgi:hypothetical protein